MCGAWCVISRVHDGPVAEGQEAPPRTARNAACRQDGDRCNQHREQRHFSSQHLGLAIRGRAGHPACRRSSLMQGAAHGARPRPPGSTPTDPVSLAQTERAVGRGNRGCSKSAGTSLRTHKTFTKGRSIFSRSTENGPAFPKSSRVHGKLPAPLLQPARVVFEGWAGALPWPPAPARRPREPTAFPPRRLARRGPAAAEQRQSSSSLSAAGADGRARNELRAGGGQGG